jgi:two-component system OmpR family sensor kinase
MALGLRSQLVGDWYRYSVSAIGTLLLAVGVGSVFIDRRLTGEELALVSALVVACVGLVALGAHLAVARDDLREHVLVVGWMSVGVLALAAFGAWFQIVASLQHTPFESALFFLTAIAAGALFGAVVGLYDVRARSLVRRASREEARGEFLRDQQESLSTLNRILRHQILNDLSAISGNAQLLEAGQRDADEAADTILAHTEHMTDVVERLETVSDVLAGATDPTATDVDRAIRQAIADVREAHPGATVSYETRYLPPVAADHLLYQAIYEVLENAAIHGGDEPTVRVDAVANGEVVVRVADDGPGVAVTPAEILFEPSERGSDSEGDGLGLFLASTILDRYGGSIEIEANGSDERAVQRRGEDGGDWTAGAGGESTDLEDVGTVFALRIPREPNR